MGERILTGISPVEMACKFAIKVERGMLNWDTFAAYMDAVNQVVPPHASITFSDAGDYVYYEFIWAENRPAEYHIESNVQATEIAARRPTEPPESPAKAEAEGQRGRGAASLPRR